MTQSAPLSDPPSSSDARDRLIASAQRLLWDVGFEAMSPRLVLADSGVGQGSLYHHFKGKKDLALAALDRLVEDLIATAEGLLTTADLLPLERVDQWLTMPRQALKGCRMGRLTSEQVMEDEALHGPVARYFTALHRLLSTVLQEAQQHGALPDTIPPEVLASSLIAVVQGGYVLSRAHMDPNHLLVAVEGMRGLLGLGNRAGRSGGSGQNRTGGL